MGITTVTSFLALAIFAHSYEFAVPMPRPARPTNMAVAPPGSGLRTDTLYHTTRSVPRNIFYKINGHFKPIGVDIGVAAFDDIIFGVVADGKICPIYMFKNSYQGVILEETEKGGFNYYPITEEQQRALNVYKPIKFEDMSHSAQFAHILKEAEDFENEKQHSLKKAETVRNHHKQLMEEAEKLRKRHEQLFREAEQLRKENERLFEEAENLRNKRRRTE
ncbi:uncharacterized protein LOC117168178 [Belonocnema kinseyi]|uniref:uncharacterized protein LOC117168178 n=1 Tax=Belonocnema kinseyi TaxID=2817044 RepID=UPI00143D7DF3|nr:uncharacterized protein LOC117168178 [Belonocnema kinseyi]